MLTLNKDPSGYYLVRSDSGSDRLIQVDWDFVYLAELFGWTPPAIGDCLQTIVEARDYLEDHIGKTIDEDAGFF